MDYFICYVQGRTDPTHFFFGLLLQFDAIPAIAELHAAIEERLALDDVAVGSEAWVVRDLDILDLRLDQWVNLESRTQLYSGCYICAIRHPTFSTAAGAVDVGGATVEKRALGFAFDAQRLFEALDANNEGVVRLQSLLKVLRRDVDYAVGLYAAMNADGDGGGVTFHSFLKLYHQEKNRGLFEELHKRLPYAGACVDQNAPLTPSTTSVAPPILPPSISPSIPPATGETVSVAPSSAEETRRMRDVVDTMKSAKSRDSKEGTVSPAVMEKLRHLRKPSSVAPSR